MCGLLGGASSYLIGSELEMIEKLFCLNTWRGKDSTGMFDWIQNPKDLHTKKRKTATNTFYWKSTSIPWMFVNEEFELAKQTRWQKGRVQLIAGHTRSATQGDIAHKNAHPFYFCDRTRETALIGMHNGTIFGDFKHRKEYDTDSEALYANIHRYGIEQALENIKDNSHAYALVWLNIEDRCVYFLRNSQRPLHYMSTGTTVYWSSEKNTLKFAYNLGKNYTVSPPEIKEFEVGVLYKLDIGKAKFEEIKIKIPEVKKWTATTTGQGYPYAEGYGIEDTFTGMDGWEKDRNGVWVQKRTQSVVPFVRSRGANSPKNTHKPRSIRSIISSKNHPMSEPVGIKWTGSPWEKENFLRGYYDVHGHSRSIATLEDLGKPERNKLWCIEDPITGFYYTSYIFGELTRCRMREQKPIHNPKGDISKQPVLPFVSELPAPEEPLPQLALPHGGERHTHKYNKTRCTEAVYLEKINRGCAYCGDPVGPLESIHWCNDVDFLCEGCKSDAGHPMHDIHNFFKYHEVSELIQEKFYDHNGDVILQTIEDNQTKH